ncbi:MAG: DeoR/GlpR family DNA-binding transcription regulator [Bacilli bacterium]|nr:DeoR/GlpR family DNA-binding transcription regulator [Bacilli bacterium]
MNRIIEAVNERRFVSLHALMELTHSSESTIRADLVELAESGKIHRIRGGAQAINDESLSYEPSLEDKLGLHFAEKRLIAQKAVTLVRPNMAVYLDAGTSTHALAEELDAPGIKIFTNSMHVARKVIANGYKAYVVGGEFKFSTDAFIGPMAQDTLSRFHFDLGFFGTNGVSLDQGFTTPDVEEAAIKAKAMEQCKEAYVLADSSKFGVVTSVSFHPFDPSHLITDHVYQDEYRNLGILEAKP